MDTRESGRCRLTHLHAAALVRHEFNPGFAWREGELLTVGPDETQRISVAVLLPRPFDHVPITEHRGLTRTGKNRFRHHRPRGVAISGIAYLNANRHHVCRLQSSSRFRVGRLTRLQALPDLPVPLP